MHEVDDCQPREKQPSAPTLHNAARSTANPELRREVILAAKDRKRAGLWLAACVLTGIFTGFSLKAITTHACNIQRTQSPPPAAASHLHNNECENGCAWLGVVLDSRRNLVRLAKVFAGSPADSAGLQAGDRIRSVAGVRVRTATQVVKLIRQHKAGDLLDVEVVRGKHCTRQVLSITAKLSEIDQEGLAKIRW